MPRPALEKRQRKWAPKVRTGCLTCKIRKKRCDEQKPICQMCLRGKYICDGYSGFSSTAKGSPAASPTDARHRVDKLPIVHAAKYYSKQQVHEAGKRQLVSAAQTFSIIVSNGCLNAALSASDHRYPQFFVVNVAPVLATTSQWRAFWGTMIPDVSTHDRSIYHAMVALSATFESKASGVDRRAMVIQQVNLAVRASLSQELSLCNVLILCRLLASVSQCGDDFRTALTHLQHGWKILTSAVRKGQLDPSIVRLLAPTFLCASTERISDLVHPVLVGDYEKQLIECLENIRSEFSQTLLSLDWKMIEGPQKTFMLSAWSIMTRASCSLLGSEMFPDMADHGTVSVQEIQVKLSAARELLNLQQLQRSAAHTFQMLRANLHNRNHVDALWPELREKLRLVVENYLVQAAEMQPNISIGIYWVDERETPCEIDNFSKFYDKDKHPVDGSATSEDDNETHLRQRRQERAYHLEFVCPYRSGLMPAFIDLDP